MMDLDWTRVHFFQGFSGSGDYVSPCGRGFVNFKLRKLNADGKASSFAKSNFFIIKVIHVWYEKLQQCNSV